MSEPILLTRNYVDDESVITVSHGNSSKHYLFDRDPASTWLTSGANSDATEISIIVEFYEGGVAVDKDIDRVLIANHNLEDWIFEYWDGSAWQTVVTKTGDTAGTTMEDFGEVNTTKVKLTATATQTTDAEKFIGEMVVCDLLLDIGRDMESDYQQRWRELSAEQIMGDGSLHKMVTRWAQNRVEKYEAQVNFDFVSEADRVTLKEIRDGGEPFIWYPERTARPTEFYLVHWAGPWAEHYASSYKGAGTRVSLSLREV